MRLVAVNGGEVEAFCDGVESAQATGEGERARWKLCSVAVPAARAGDAPARPSQAVSWMRVPLFFGLAFELAHQRLDDGDFGRAEDARSGKPRTGLAAPLDKLHDARGGDEPGRRQALERVAVAQETVFEVETLRFEHAEELFHDPAIAIEVDDPRRLGERACGMRGQQTPDDRLFGRRRVDLARLDELERDAGRIAPVGAAQPDRSAPRASPPAPFGRDGRARS